jgi:dihydrofolate reductase
MPIFHAIAAMSENRVIGNQGKIPWHIPEDFRWFKHKTMGGTLIMGRKTFESIGKPLPGRKTVVLTHRPIDTPGVETCSTIRKLPSDNSWTSSASDICWVCGGSQIYRQLLPKCYYLYLTRVKQRVLGDAIFPNFEDNFVFEYVIHETHTLRIERWLNPDHLWKDYNREKEEWPFKHQKHL